MGLFFSDRLDIYVHLDPTALAILNRIEGEIMGLKEDLNAKLDTSLANQEAMQVSLTNIAADEAALKQQIADLIAAGGGNGISQADAEALLAKATTLADASSAAASQAAGIDADTP